jgi:bacterioferritin-associated ferredoxin
VLHWVHRHNRPLVLDNGVGILGGMQEMLDKTGMRSAAIFPLSHRGRPVGALVLGRKTGPSPFVFVDLTLVTLFGHLLSTTFERLHFFEWMQANAARWEAGSMRTDQMSREVALPPRRAGRVHPPDSPSAAAHKSDSPLRPELRSWEEQHMYICLCKGITETELGNMVARHSGSWEGVKRELGLDESCCGRCEAQLEELIKEVVPSGRQ